MKEKIYLDKEGYQKYLESIEILKSRLSEISKGRKEAFEASSGDGWDSPEFEEIERQERVIEGELNRKYEELSRIVIIEKHNNEEIIDIGDVLVVDMVYSEDDCEEFTFKLVGSNGEFDAELPEISLNSPLGKAVYKKKIGENSFYEINNQKIEIFIREKVNMKEEQQILRNSR